MTPDPERIRKIAVLLMVLVAGCLDAIGYVHEEIFPANMTGNAVLVAAALTDPSPLEHAKIPALVLFSFCGGVALGALLIHSLRNHLNHSFNLVFFLSGMLVFLCGFSLSLTPAPFTMLHFLIIAAAMGMQSSAALTLNVSGAGITTVITSTLTTAVSRIVAALCAIFTSRNPTEISWPIFPLMVFCIYAAGAFLGVCHRAITIGWMILLSGIILMMASALSTYSSRLEFKKR
jgi:uncharacterized membrane protein YoaK (UPF0700 family)